MFEKITKIDNSRESDGPREKHVSIEMTDQQHREKLEAMKPTGMAVKFNTSFVYRPPTPEEMSPECREKWELAEKLTKDTKVIKLKEGKKNVRKTRKTTKKAATENNPESNATAVAQVQTEL